MPVLKNRKHERFAQLLAQGKGQREAYVAAGYKDAGGAEAQASRTARQPLVTARVAELLQEQRQRLHDERARAVEIAGFDRAKILTTLEDVVNRCMQYTPVLDEKGNPVMVEVPSKDGKGAQLAAAYTFDAKGAVAALKLLGMEQPDPMFINRHEVRRNPLDMLAPEVARLIVAKLAAAGQFGVGLHRLPAQPPREVTTIDQPAAEHARPELGGQPAAGGTEGALPGGAAEGS